MGERSLKNRSPFSCGFSQSASLSSPPLAWMAPAAVAAWSVQQRMEEGRRERTEGAER